MATGPLQLRLLSFLEFLNRMSSCKHQMAKSLLSSTNDSIYNCRLHSKYVQHHGWHITQLDLEDPGIGGNRNGRPAG